MSKQIKLVVSLTLLLVCLRPGSSTEELKGKSRFLGLFEINRARQNNDLSREFKELNERLVKAVRSEDAETNMQKAVEWLQSGFCASPSLNAALREFVKLNSLECNQDGWRTLMANGRAINSRSKLLSSSPSRVLIVLNHFRRKHANKCQVAFSSALSKELAKLSGREGLNLYYVRMLTMGAIESSYNQFEDFSSRLEWQLTKEPFGPSSSAEKYFADMPLGLIKTLLVDLQRKRLQKSFYYDAMNYLSRHDSDNVYLSKGHANRSHKPSKLKEMYDWYLVAPCSYFVNELVPSVQWTLNDLSLVEAAKIKEEYMRTFDLHFTDTCNSFCKKLLDSN